MPFPKMNQFLIHHLKSLQSSIVICVIRSAKVHFYFSNNVNNGNSGNGGNEESYKNGKRILRVYCVTEMNDVFKDFPKPLS